MKSKTQILLVSCFRWAVTYSILLTLFQRSYLFAQNTNPPYLRDMPSVDRVIEVMQAADPAETAARQMGALLQLKKIIEDMAGPRIYNRAAGLTPDETRLIQQYYGAYYRVQQSKPEYKPFTAMRGYDTSPQFRSELFQKLFPPTFAAEYTKLTGQAVAQFQAQHEARIQAENNAMKNAPAGDRETKATAEANEKARRDLSRCVSSGENENACMLKVVGSGLGDMMESVVPGVKPKAPPGLVLLGTFSDQHGFDINFDFGGVSRSGQASFKCGQLMNDSHTARIEMRDGGPVIVVESKPKPIVLTLGSEGKLSGPGSVEVAGRIQTGPTVCGGGGGTAVASSSPANGGNGYLPATQTATTQQYVGNSMEAAQYSQSAGFHGDATGGYYINSTATVPSYGSYQRLRQQPCRL